MSNIKPVVPQFHEGDEVVLVEGSYQGTLGVFIGLKDDAKWADIRERDGSIRSHPVEWLSPSSGPDKRSPN